MNKIKNKNWLRWSLSGAALVLYLFYLMVHFNYFLHLWSLGEEASVLIKRTVIPLIGLIPIVAQFVLALFADLTKRINKRFFVVLFFVILFAQHWFVIFELFTSFAPHMTDISKAIFGDNDIFDFLIYILTMIAMVFSPIASSVMIKVYSVALTALNTFGFIYNSVLYIAGERTSFNVLLSLIGGLFSLALYTFNDYLTEDNIFEFVAEVFKCLGKPIFGNRYDKPCIDDGFEEDLDCEFDGVFDSVEVEDTYEGHSKDYKKLLALAIYEDRNDVLDSATKISDFKDCPEKVGT